MRWRRSHQLPNRVEDDVKLGVVFLFYVGQLRVIFTFVSRSARNRTKARMIAVLTAIACGLRKILEIKNDVRPVKRWDQPSR